MTKQTNEIPTAELFADLQVSLTEILLIELLGDSELAAEFSGRLNINSRVRDTIKSIMTSRFSHEEIANFLRRGFPRRVDLNNVIAKNTTV